MSSKDLHNVGPTLSISEIIRPLLIVAVCVGSLWLLLDRMGGAAGAFQRQEIAPWRLGLLFLGCTIAVIAFQVFFTQYFEVRVLRKRLLWKLRASEIEDAALLAALSHRAETSAVDEELSAAPGDVSQS